jgi:hypothetical protein
VPAGTGTATVACQLIGGKTVVVGVHEYLKTAVMFPQGFDARTVGEDYRAVGPFFDFVYYGYPAGAPVWIVPDHERGSPDPVINLLVSTGECKAATGCPLYSGLLTGGGFSSRGLAIPGPYLITRPGQISRGQWYEIIVHVYWSLDNNGLVEAWFRPKGSSTWTQGLTPKTGFPTLSWGDNTNCQAIQTDPCYIDRNMVNGKKASTKFGFYSPPAVSAQRIYFDSTCSATSFDAAAAC